MSSLSHHGIKGQRWGVRRFQNKDGTRTAAGKKEEKLRRLKKTTSEDFISIRKTLSDTDLQMLNYDDESIKYMRENGSLDRDPITNITAHRVIQKDRNGTPVAYVEGTGFTADSLLSGKAAARVISIDLATRSGEEYRGKGHAVAAGKKMVKWFDRYGYKDYEYMEWAAKEENIASQKTAEKLGFKKLNIEEPGWTLYTYSKEATHTSIGGIMYIEGNALILGDSSYLEHHGILGQKWGVRRFQNKDGTRTAAGKAREDRRVLKKGTTVKRTSYGMYDETYDNKKYVSTNDDDAGKWSRYIGEAKARQGAVVFENEYKLTRDVAVATGKDICKIIDSEFKNADVTKLKEDTDYAARALRQDLNNMSREERVSLNFAMQTQSGKKIVKLLKKHGYDALEDDHGKNVSKDPVIILDPEKNMKRTRVTANTRYYFNYINHTSIDDSPHLSHHGIKGQRWGVRRFQNKDGTRTAAGKKRYSVEAVDVDQTRGEIKNLVKRFSKKDKEMFFDKHHPDGEYDKSSVDDLVERGVAKRFVVKEGKNIVGFIDAEYSGRVDSSSLNVVIGVDKSARGKGYASILSKKLVDWYDSEGYRNTSQLEWNAYDENVGSKKAAEKAGFKQINDDFDNTANYVYGKNKGDIDNLSRLYKKQVAVGKEVDTKINEAFKKTTIGKLSPDTHIEAYGRSFTPFNTELNRYKSYFVDPYANRWVKKRYSEDIDRYNKTYSEWASAYEKYNKKLKAKHTSIGGIMYIEGNALILGDSSYLEHHGIKGQRWGVRRFQNKDGTRTAAGKKRDTENLKSSQEAKNVNSKIHSYINKQLSSEDLDTGKSNYDFASHLIKDPDFEKVIMPVVQDIRQTKAKYGNKEPYELTGDEHQAYMNDISRIDNKTGELAITIGLAEKGEPHKKSTPPEGEYERVDMFRYALARYLDEHSPDGYSDEGDWIYHTSIDDSTPYLSHHGIRGQRWGVRRFQNRDGSLTNAGRKRLGYATKGAVQTVGKAFKAGVKVGGNAVKAAKAHHEKKEAEKLQKKKEKASKTRLGVMANKDLFTNEEFKKLNDRFKLEDEMKMATLQKGVEIAKAVGTIAQNVGTVAKTYEDVTGQSLSPIKRKAAEEKVRQEKEDRERRLAREDAEEARKAAKEERDIAIHEQTLRKAIASADTQEFTAKKTKAEADSSILDLYKKGREFNDGSDATGQSWVEKAKSGGKNPFDDMIANRDPEYAQIRKEHDEKVARKERMEYLDRREKEREAEKAAASRQDAPQQKQGGDDALFSQKGSLPIDKDRYRNNRAMEKAKQVKENAAEERAKKQDEKAAKATIDDMMEARRQFTDSARANSNGAFDRETAANYIKGKAKELPNKLNPVNAIAKKITNKALKEEEDNARKAMEDEYKKASRSQGRDEANYTMYYNRVNALQAQGYSERQAKKVADTENPFSSKRNRRFEYNEKVGEIETTHRKNAKEINKANKELTDYYYKLVNGPGYEPGSPKREALDRKYAQKRGELEKLEKDNNDMLDREKKKAKKILEHSFTIQNGVLFVDSSDGFAHHGVKGQRWGVRRFQNPDGTLTAAGKKRDASRITKELNKNDKALAWEHRHISDRTDDYERWDKKAKKAENKGNLEKAEKFKQKRDETSAKLEEHRKNAKSMGEKTVSLISEATKKGYDIKTKDTRRSVNTGGEIAANIALNVLAAAAGSPVLIKRQKYVEGTKYKVKVKHDAFTIQDGILFINAGEPYLEHHGVKGMKWGKHLMAGKGEAGAGGGSGEDDEKLKEMAKKAGMSVAEFRTKMAGKIGETGEKPKSFKEKAYDALGGKYKTQAAEAHREMVQKRNDADDKARRANAQGRAANANKRAGNVREYMANKEGARQLDAEAKGARTSQWEVTKKANRAQWKYDHSIAGLYDKATGKYKQAHKKTAIPKTIDRWKYEYTDGPNSKLHNNGGSKAKTAKEQAKASVWNAADHQIKAKEYNDVANSYGGNTNYYGQAYKNAAEREGRLSEASYRKAAALGKQASSETSTSSRPRARKKKHTSGGSGVTVRRPGRKPVSRTKRVTKSSTGVKRRSATGTGARVR